MAAPPPLSASLAALFAPRPAAPAPVAPPPSTAAAPTTTPGNNVAAIFGKAAPAITAITTSRPTQTLDIRAAATAALAKTGYYAASPAGESGSSEAPAPQAFSFPTVAQPMVGGLFRGIKGANKPKGPPKPRIVKQGAVSLKDLFKLAEEPAVAANSRIADAQRRAGVADSSELKRILAITRRPPAINTAPDLSDEFRRTGSTATLWARQSAAIHEARLNDGLFASISVGGGKTLISLAIGAALKARQIVLLVPPALRSQLLNVDIPRYARDWKLPLDRIRIVAYSQLSNAKSRDILDEILPDVIVADEMHQLRHRSAARTKRFLRYMKEHPECRFAGMSGTITRRSLKDYQHLAELALRKNSPLPRDFGSLCEWAEALDVSDEPMAPGALVQFCSEAETAQIERLAEKEPPEDFGAITPAQEIQTIVRGAFRRRFVETPGVVATEEGSVDSSLNIHALRPLVPAEVQTAIRDVRTKWRVDDEELVDALSVARVAKQLASGFRYKWMWPENKPDTEWLLARKEWKRDQREILKRSRKGLDSPFLIASACERGDLDVASYEVWRKVKDRQKPPIETIWTSDFMVKHAVTWATENATKTEPLIIWYSWDCIGRAIAAAGNYPLFGAGKAASEGLTRVDVKRTPVIVCSIAAHGTGKNLQAFCQNLVTTPPSGGVEFEQLLGRCHRPGQLADEVNCYVYVHTIEMEGSFRNAVRDAAYIEQTTGQRQKLNFAEKIGFAAEAFMFYGNSKPETDGLTWPTT